MSEISYCRFDSLHLKAMHLVKKHWLDIALILGSLVLIILATLYVTNNIHHMRMIPFKPFAFVAYLVAEALIMSVIDRIISRRILSNIDRIPEKKFSLSSLIVKKDADSGFYLEIDTVESFLFEYINIYSSHRDLSCAISNEKIKKYHSKQLMQHLDEKSKGLEKNEVVALQAGIHLLVRGKALIFSDDQFHLICGTEKTVEIALSDYNNPILIIANSKKLKDFLNNVETLKKVSKQDNSGFPKILNKQNQKKYLLSAVQL